LNPIRRILRRWTSTAAQPGPVPCQVLLSTWLASRNQVDWALEPSGARRLQPGDRGILVAFQPELLRIAGRARGNQAAKSLVLRGGHAQERVRVVNRSLEEGAIHAAPVRVLDALLDTPARRAAVVAIAPGLLLVDRLRVDPAAALPAAGPQAVLLDLGLPDGVRDTAGERLVVAVVYRQDGLPPATTCSLTVEPIEDVARLVLYEHRVPEGTPWAVFGPSQVLAACAGLACWPIEDEWAGVPLRHLRGAAALLCLLLAATSALRASLTLGSVASTEREAAQWRERAASLHQALAARLIADPRGLAHAASVDPAAEVARAQGLWRPGARVAIDADLRRSEYTVTLPLLRPAATSAGRVMPAVPIPAAWSNPLFALEPPPGCRPTEPRIRGALDEIAMVVVCPRADSSLSALLPR
jgi:hypothetical protein